MTPEQSTQFDLFGCGPRCLITLANARGAGLTKASFIDKFAPKYWAAGDRCGITSDASLKELALELGICSGFRQTADFREIRDLIRRQVAAGILLLTEKRYEENGQLSDYFHCTLISHQALQGDDLLLLDVDYITGTGRGVFLPDKSILPLVPRFLVLLP